MTVRMTLRISPEMDDVLETIAAGSGSTKSNVIRQAIALIKIAHETKQNGNHLGIVSDPDLLDTEIIGLL